MTKTPQEEVTNAILKYAGGLRRSTPSVRTIEEFVLKPMIEARMDMQDLKTHHDGFPLQTHTKLVQLCEIVIGAAEARARHRAVGPQPLLPDRECLALARALKKQYETTPAGQVAALSNEEFAAALELTMAREVSGGRRGAEGLMERAQRLERIADEAPAPLREGMRGIVGKVREAIVAAYKRGPR
jgi:hypothetical protein